MLRRFTEDSRRFPALLAKASQAPGASGSSSKDTAGRDSRGAW